LLKDTRAALSELGIDIGTLAEFSTVENTPKVHNLIVCTLCSCYPKMLLGIPPAWYKSLAYRSRTVVDPRGVLADFGVELPKDVEVRVHDSTADLRYIVLPMRPKGTRDWSETELAGLVTRDSMIGTAVVAAPSPASRRRRES
jgi:nitrile hydratase